MGRRKKGEGSITYLEDSNRYQVRITMEGGRRVARYAYTEEEAVEVLFQLRQEKSAGVLSDANAKLKDYLPAWLKNVEPRLSVKTAHGYHYVCKKIIIPALGRKKLSQVRVADVEGMMTDLRKRKSVDAANRARKVLNTALNDAVRRQLLLVNPVKVVRTLSAKNPSDMTIWTKEEAARFLSEAKGHRLYALFLLTMSTGLRMGEVRGLRWADVKGNIINVRSSAVDVNGRVVFQEATKTASSRRKISIPQDVVMELKLHRRAQLEQYQALGFTPDRGLVFDSEAGTILSSSNIHRVYRRFKNRAEVQPATFHDLRHWHASMLFDQGWSLPEIARRLGHANPAVTLQIYSHVIDFSRLDDPPSLEDVLSDVRFDATR